MASVLQRRVERLGHTPCGPQSLKYVLRPLQKTFATSVKKQGCRVKYPEWELSGSGEDSLKQWHLSWNLRVMGRDQPWQTKHFRQIGQNWQFWRILFSVKYCLRGDEQVTRLWHQENLQRGNKQTQNHQLVPCARVSSPLCILQKGGELHVVQWAAQ